MRKLSIFGYLLFVSLFLIAGCTRATVTPVNTVMSVPVETSTQSLPQTMNQIDCAFQTVTPADVKSEIVQANGSAPLDQQFSVENDTDVRIFWTQSTQDNFDLALVNQDPALANSVEKTTTLESYVGASSGCVDTSLKAGNYQISVIQANGPWKVWVEAIKYR